MIKKLLTKLAVICLIFSLPAVGLTSSDFVDTESSLGNIFTATTLDLSLKDTSDVLLIAPFFNETGFKPGSSSTKTLRINKDGVEDFNYQLSISKTGGDDNLCNALKVEAKLEGISKYNGSLLGLTLSPVISITDNYDDWTFIISLSESSDALKNKTCNFSLKAKGWQQDSDGTWGLSDEESLGNNVSTTTWSNTPDVVINEVMWMGSKGDSDDEWIELKNTTSNPINLTGWVLENGGSSSHPNLALAGTIPANSYFLISNKATNFSAINNGISSDLITTSLSLNNSGEQLTLKNSSGTVIDQTPAGAWVAGDHGSEEKSMERNNDPATGWHTCNTAACHSITYWDADANNWGTPKAANLSENDPSAPEFKQDLTPKENSPSADLDLEIEASPSAEATSSGTILEPTPSPEPTETPVPTPTPVEL